MRVIITHEMKLECVRRELKQRKHVYAHRVATGKMSPVFAEEQIKLMAAIVEDYEASAQSERLL